MFTGIIQGLATITSIERKPGLLAFSVSLPDALGEHIEQGASIAVNGVCLTVTSISEPHTVSFDVMQETLDKTTLGSLQVGDRVNIERSAKFGDEIGGHIVSGHVQGTAKIVNIDSSENNKVLTFEIPRELSKYIFEKGFIAVDGASLTVVESKPSSFSVSLIPETLKRTTFGDRKLGDTVNIEVEQATKTIVDTLERLDPERMRRT